jgi:hypothetical protein
VRRTPQEPLNIWQCANSPTFKHEKTREGLSTAVLARLCIVLECSGQGAFGKTGICCCSDSLENAKQSQHQAVFNVGSTTSHTTCMRAPTSKYTGFTIHREGDSKGGAMAMQRRTQLRFGMVVWVWRKGVEEKAYYSRDNEYVRRKDQATNLERRR